MDSEKKPKSQNDNSEQTFVESTVDPVTTTDETVYPPCRDVLLISIALYLAVFLVALDGTIIATAVPTITDQFHSLNDIGWYGSSYLITSCAFQLLFGKIYTFYSPKWVFLSSIGLFEIGSVVCGAAPTSKAFIVGRAIAGLGSAGVFSGVIIIIVYLVPLHKRPMFTGLIGACFGIASVVGPVLGGAFTSHVSWRWCFYINLPIGAVTVAIIFVILTLPSPKNNSLSIREQFAQLDPIGTLVFLPSIVCLLLALQWGGFTYAWKDSRIIALLIIFGVLGLAFIALQMWKQEAATVPPRIFKQRSIASAVWFSICIGATLQVLAFYLPIWFQAIKDVSPIKSGIDNLPLILALVVAAIVNGAFVSQVGYYNLTMIASSVIMSVGAGLVTTFRRDTGHAQWIGYQVIYGFGLGLGMQQSGIAAQTVLSKQDIPVGAALMFFARSLGGAVFVSISQNILETRLVSGLVQVAGLNVENVITAGATNLRTVVTPEQLDGVLTIYNEALTHAFDVALAVSCASIIGALAMEWRSVKRARSTAAGKA